MHTLFEVLGKMAINHHDQALIVTCHEGKIHYLNSRAEELFSTDLARAKENGWRELLSSADSQQIDKLEKQLFTNKENSKQDPKKTKQLLPDTKLMVHAQAIDEDNDCLGILWTLTSTQDTPDELNPQQKEQRYQQIFHTNENAQWVIDIRPLRQFLHDQNVRNVKSLKAQIKKQPDYLSSLVPYIRFLDANEATARLYDASNRTEWMSLAVKKISKKDLFNSAYAALKVDDGPTTNVYFSDVDTFTGEKKSLRISAWIPGLETLHHGILVSAIDISAIKAAETELEERQQFLGAILRTVPDFLFVYDFEREEHIFANVDIGAYLGYSKEQIAEAGDKLLNYIIHPEDRFKRDHMYQLRHALAEEKVYERTMRIQDSDGEWHYFYFRSAPLEFNQQGEALYAVVVARDITHILKTEQSLNEKERRFRLLEDNFSDVIITADEHLTIDYVSPSVSQLLSCSPEEFLAMTNPNRYKTLGLSAHLGTLVSDYEQALRQCSKLAYEGDEYQRIIESDITQTDGTRLPVELKISLLIGQEHQEIQGILIICRDISERRRVEADMRLAAKVFENSLEGIYITNREGCIAQVNTAFSSITGHKAEYAIGKRPAFLNSGWHDHHFISEIKPVLDDSGYWQGELINRRASGEVFPAWVGITEVRSKHNEFLGYITTFRDITEAKDSEQRIRKLAYFDPLTDLPNRSLFQDRLNQELQRCQRNKSHVALLFLDLDRFKIINDSMGHAVGDRLLTEAARRLRDSIRGDDTVARMGGDEFTIILSDLSDRENAESAAAQVSLKVMQALTDPFLLQDRELYISTSIGIAVYPEDGQDGEELLKNADTAMYHTKAAGKNGYQFYTDAMNARSLERLELHNKLHSAVAEKQFELCFLPIHSLADERVTGIEALIRWRQGDKTLLKPSQFMSLVEESGLGGEVGLWVLQEACLQMADWLSQGSQIERVAVNIAPSHFSDGDLIDHVIQVLDQSGLAPYQLELELSENLLMHDIGYTQALLQDLQALGVRISVDDFGTGFSSLHYLKQLPVNSLKIDRSFVRHLPQSAEDTRIAQAVIAVAQSFELNVIAEGVENNLQVNYLATLGCQEAQGYYFGKPQTINQINKVLSLQAG